MKKQESFEVDDVLNLIKDIKDTNISKNNEVSNSNQPKNNTKKEYNIDDEIASIIEESNKEDQHPVYTPLSARNLQPTVVDVSPRGLPTTEMVDPKQKPLVPPLSLPNNNIQPRHYGQSSSLPNLQISKSSRSPRSPNQKWVPKQNNPLSDVEKSRESLSHFERTHRGTLVSETLTQSVPQGPPPFNTPKPAHAVVPHLKLHPGTISTPATTLAGHAINPSIPHEAPLTGRDKKEGLSLNANIHYTPRSTEFSIPTLPKGKTLCINIRSTWGDPYYVGLSGLEMFDHEGKLITLSKPAAQITAEPASVNVLPENANDPRTIEKIVDGHNKTQDDFHVWLAPWNAGKDHYIVINFDKECTLSMLRFWNYNKSRIHSFRGIKDVEMELDKKVIFKGEIQKAPGVLDKCEEYTECILFTLDDNILTTIRKNAAYFEPYEVAAQQEVDDNLAKLAASRPTTAASRNTPRELAEVPVEENLPESVIIDMIRAQSKEGKRPRTGIQYQPSGGLNTPFTTNENYPTITTITLNITETWGDQFYVGLCGIKLLDGNLKDIPLKISNISANPKDITHLAGCSNDKRTLDKLIDGVTLTTENEHMWLIPFSKGGNHVITIKLDAPTKVAYLIIWNYNKSEEDSFRGVKRMTITLDDQVLFDKPGYIVRKAPGHILFDYGQFISFGGSSQELISNYEKEWAAVKEKLAQKVSLYQDYETPLLPSGFILKLVFLSTHGDAYYIGLNGIEVYDWQNNKIPLTARNAAAVPPSVSVLPEMKDDERTIDKLFDGVNNTYNDKHMWLTLFTPGKPTYMFIHMNDCASISLIKFWNYSKTPSRGVNEFEIYLDDSLIYTGVLKPAPTRSPSANKPMEFCQSILFTSDEKVIQKERNHVFTCGGAEQPVQFINDRKIMSRPASTPGSSQGRRTPLSGKRPKTSVVGNN